MHLRGTHQAGNGELVEQGRLSPAPLIHALALPRALRVHFKTSSEALGSEPRMDDFHQVFHALDLPRSVCVTVFDGFEMHSKYGHTLHRIYKTSDPVKPTEKRCELRAVAVGHNRAFLLNQ